MAAAPLERTADLLVVGGTESGCAAAVQAARMGVTNIVLVNDIEWLGGQFSAEALGAIDENRETGYVGTVPIPRSGLFRETIDRIETLNSNKYAGIARPGNTLVITTSRPSDSEQVFRELLAPYEAQGVIRGIPATTRPRRWSAPTAGRSKGACSRRSPPAARR
jgi:glycine/D-amino acid oxidase-like deaminating enzyme